MSLFDVIRYPISVPPTAEELLRLPDTLYEVWVLSNSPKIFPGESISFHKVYVDQRTWFAGQVKSCMEGGSDRDRCIADEIIRDLRKLINNYEE